MGLVLILVLAGRIFPKTTAKQSAGSLNLEAEETAAIIEEAAAAPQNTGLLFETSAAKPTKNADAEPLSLIETQPVSEPLPSSMPNRIPPVLIPAEAYLSVQLGQMVYDPIPLLGDKELRITQKDGKVNIISLTKTSISMKSSTCDNQSCVHQGVVTLENMSKRVLQNMIICLPNEVILSLLTPQEAQVQWDSLYGGDQPKEN